MYRSHLNWRLAGCAFVAALRGPTFPCRLLGYDSDDRIPNSKLTFLIFVMEWSESVSTGVHFEPHFDAHSRLF